MKNLGKTLLAFLLVRGKLSSRDCQKQFFMSHRVYTERIVANDWELAGTSKHIRNVINT
jgi:hypothetical protein